MPISRAPRWRFMVPFILACVPRAHGAEPTAAQAYATHCAGCHGATLGGAYGPPLSGAAFVARWQGKPAAGLLAQIRATMPPARP
ncbi:MAG: c-type cytochrome, partial [Gammaproteobacteria bacterium]